MANKTKIVFLLKKNNGSGGYAAVPKSGLITSAEMVAAELKRAFDVDTEVHIVIDGNSIDKVVFNSKADICVLEAIWATPSKLEELTKLHPNVTFVVRVHSEIPFLAHEGNAISWIRDLAHVNNVYIAFNSYDTYRDFREMDDNSSYIYLPNIYEKQSGSINLDLSKEIKRKIVDIGCFGAIRPLKNQLIQAAAAIIFANNNKLKLRFHINGSRVEQGGESTLKNIKALFDNTRHELVEHDWLDRDNFLDIVNQMDIGMQVSFTESFNIVTADFVAKAVPIVTSNAIKWMPKQALAPVWSARNIADKLDDIKDHYFKHILTNKLALSAYNKDSLNIWKSFLRQ